MIALRPVQNILKSKCKQSMKDALFAALSARVVWYECPVDQLFFSLGVDVFVLENDEITRSYLNIDDLNSAEAPPLKRESMEKVLDRVKYFTCHNGPLMGRLVACFGLDPYLVQFYPVSLERVCYSKWANVLIPDNF
jgi:hypothetical protein